MLEKIKLHFFENKFQHHVLCIKIHIFQKHKFWQNMTQNWFVTWFFMKNAFCKNIKLPLKTSRLAWKNHKKSPRPPCNDVESEKKLRAILTQRHKIYLGGGGDGYFFMFFSCEAWKVHPHEKHIIFKFYFFFLTKNDVFKNRVCKNLRFRSRRQAGLRPAVRRPYAGRPPAGLRLCTVLGPGRRPTGQPVIFPL